MMLIFLNPSARAEKGGRDGDELDGFIQEKFRSVIVGDPVINKAGEKHLILSGSIRGRTFVGNVFATCLHYLTIDSISAQR